MTIEVIGQDDFLIIGNDSILLKRDYYSIKTIDSSENRIYRKQVEPFGTDSFPKPRRLLKEYLFLRAKLLKYSALLLILRFLLFFALLLFLFSFMTLCFESMNSSDIHI